METIGLILSCIVSLIFIFYFASKKNKNQLQQIFFIDIFLTFGVCLLSLAQK